jgi:hypothetical protein
MRRAGAPRAGRQSADTADLVDTARRGVGGSPVRVYAHLSDDQPDHIAWVLTGRIAERGPDNEPLLVDVQPIARLQASVLREAADNEPRSPRDDDDSS